MGNINVLDSSVYNRIAAGEVVQQPSSVVKELIENCIDAGANEITVEIKDGGIKEIFVKDNGSGMSAVDLKTAFLPHATSKVKTIDDLDTVSTLGFRGEALASIASVAHVIAKSRDNSSDIGSKIEIRGGDYSEIEPTSCPIGTEISVRNLFFNTPARAKFLRKPFQEEADVLSVVQKTAFSNPFISITYLSDNKMVFRTTGEGLLSAIKSIYGIEISNACIPVDYKKGNLSITGFVCNPSTTKPNRNYQTIIINGRYVKDFAFSASISNAFGDRLMKRCFPIFVLDLVIPFDSVDVNVHPAKTEVRFKKPSEIYSLAYNAVKKALESLETASNIGLSDIFNTKETGDEAPKSDTVIQETQNFTFNTHSSPQSTYKKSTLFDTYISSNENTNSYKLAESNGINYSLIKKLLNENTQTDSNTIENSNAYNNTDDEKLLISDSTDNCDYGVLGQIFDCYLLVKVKNSLIIIDQHAAYERLLFDELTQKTNNKERAVQQLLLPYVRTFSQSEYVRISDISNELCSLGFEIEEFGKNTIKVSSIPLVLTGIKFDEFFDGFLSDFDNKSDFSYADLLRDKLAMRACRSAIKAGDSLSETQIKSIIKQIVDTNMTLQCPHGRPICIRFSKKDLEKMFKRIV